MGGAGGGRTRPGEGLQVRIPATQAESLRGGEVTGKACATEEEFRKRERGEGAGRHPHTHAHTHTHTVREASPVHGPGGAARQASRRSCFVSQGCDSPRCAQTRWRNGRLEDHVVSKDRDGKGDTNSPPTEACSQDPQAGRRGSCEAWCTPNQCAWRCLPVLGGISKHVAPG